MVRRKVGPRAGPERIQTIHGVQLDTVNLPYHTRSTVPIWHMESGAGFQ